MAINLGNVNLFLVSYTIKLLFLRIVRGVLHKDPCTTGFLKQYEGGRAEWGKRKGERKKKKRKRGVDRTHKAKIVKEEQMKQAHRYVLIKQSNLQRYRSLPGIMSL